MKTIVESSSAGKDSGSSAQNSGLPGGQPGPGAEVSLPDASQHGTILEGDLAVLVEQEVSRHFQSGKDKRWAQLEKQYRDLSTLREDADALLATVSAAEAAAGERDAAPVAAREDWGTRSSRWQICRGSGAMKMPPR